MAETDVSEEAEKRRIGHFTRVLLAWWKAANFIKSRDTALFFQRLIKQAVQSEEALHKWPKYIEGISIYARGVSGPKENPYIDFDYSDGYTPPPMNMQSKRQPNPQLRTLATGGTLPPTHAAKRARQEAPHQNANTPQDTAGNDVQQMENNESARATHKGATIAATQNSEVPTTPLIRRSTESPAYLQTPTDHGNALEGQNSQYFTTTAAGPSTPAAEKSIYNHIQESTIIYRYRPDPDRNCGPLTPVPRQRLAGWTNIETDIHHPWTHHTIPA